MNNNFKLMLRKSATCGGLLSVAILLGCSSDGGSSGSGTTTMVTPTPTTTGGGGGGGAGHDEFVKNLYPLLQPCAGCHVSGAGGAPIYMGADAESTYTKIKTVKNIFTASGDSSLPSKPDHAGKALDEAGKAEAKKWLDIEFPPATGGDNPSTPAPGGGVTGFNGAIQEFIKCMRQDDWEQNMKFFPMVQTQNFGPCAGCHEDGNGGTFLNADFNVTFKAMKTVPYVYRLVSGVFEGGSVDHLEANDRLILKGQQATDCFDPNNNICHDLYIVPKVQAQGLKNFQSSTLSRIQDLKCIEP